MIRAEDEDMFGDLEEFRARPGGGEGAGGMKYVSHQVSTVQYSVIMCIYNIYILHCIYNIYGVYNI